MSARGSVINAFFGSRLGRRFLLALFASLTASSLVFLFLFAAAYRGRLIEEHARASSQVNELLEVSLKNAMLKRDIAGLRGIVRDLGKQDGIASVMILNPAGEIRFASEPASEGGHFAAASGTDILKPSSAFIMEADGTEVLRTINPVSNEERCNACHGPIADHPVNGILVVDYAAGQIRRDAMLGTLAMTLSGGAVLLAALISVATVLYRSVLKPVRTLTEATARFAEGDLGKRVVTEGDHELAALGGRFNDMADRIGSTMKDLRNSEAFLQTIIDAVPDGARVIDDDFNIVKANAAYARSLGSSPTEILGQKCHRSSHGLAMPCSPTMVICPVVQLAQTGEPTLKCRQRHLRPGQGEVFVEVSAARVEIAEKGILKGYTIEIVRDLAEQITVSHEQRLSEIGLLATGIAHEIHNPLSSIHLALRAMRADIASAQPAGSVDEYLEIAEREINRCIDVTQRLLRLSEPAGSGGVLIDVKAVVEDVVSLLRYQAEQANVTITSEFSGAARVLGDESDIGILVLNLSQNAIHAMPVGGTLTIGIASRDNKVHMSFTDTGVGVPKEDIAKIFWPFWSKRADGSSGTGLGLAICKATVDRLSGTIGVESTVGKGTTISIILPSADSREAS